MTAVILCRCINLPKRKKSKEEAEKEATLLPVMAIATNIPEGRRIEMTTQDVIAAKKHDNDADRQFLALGMGFSMSFKLCEGLWHMLVLDEVFKDRHEGIGDRLSCFKAEAIKAV